MFGLNQRLPFEPLEVSLMVAGAIFTWADFEGHIELSGRFIGVIAWFGSLLGGSLNMALAGVLGDTKLNVLDTAPTWPSRPPPSFCRSSSSSPSRYWASGGA